MFLLNGKQIRFTVCKRFWTLLRFYGLYTRNNHFKIFLLLHYIDMIFYFYSDFNFGELLTNYWPRMRSDLSTVIQYLSITDRSVTSMKCLCITSLFCKALTFLKRFPYLADLSLDTCRKCTFLYLEISAVFFCQFLGKPWIPKIFWVILYAQKSWAAALSFNVRGVLLL